MFSLTKSLNYYLLKGTPFIDKQTLKEYWRSPGIKVPPSYTKNQENLREKDTVRHTNAIRLLAISRAMMVFNLFQRFA